MFLKRSFIYFSLFALTACQSTSHLKPMTGGPINENNLSVGEKRLWSMSDDAEQQIRRSGKIFKQKNAQQYLERILFRLYPTQVGNMKIFIIKRPILNAFAFPNGSIYIHTGIISAAKNEDQLAAVVAHEGAHFILKHSAKSRIKRNNMTSFIVMVNLMGIPLLGELIGISSISGYSKDLEREADMMGAKRMLDAGYDITEAHKIFEFMASESKANDTEEPFFFSTHPKLLERIENFKKFAENNVQAKSSLIVKNNNFIESFLKVENYALHKKLEMGRYSSLINEVSYDTQYWDQINKPEEKIVYAEAYRLRGKEGDFSEAKKLIEKIITVSPKYWKSYLSLGVIALQQGDLELANRNLLMAQRLTNDDNGYISMYLNKLKNKGEHNND